MTRYIGTKLVKAEPAFMVNGKLVIVDNFGTPIPAPPKADMKAGYKVCYPDGYEHCPGNLFRATGYTANSRLEQETQQLPHLVLDFVQANLPAQLLAVVLRAHAGGALHDLKAILQNRPNHGGLLAQRLDLHLADERIHHIRADAGLVSL